MAPPQHAGLLQFLSLFLLLIVFFLFLISLSRVEVDRSQRVIGSLNTAFRAEVIGPERAVTPAAGPIASATRLQRDLTGLLRAQMTVAGIEVVRLGTKVRVTMPAYVLFRDGASEPSAQRTDFLEWVAGAIRNDPSGLRYEVELLVGRPVAPGADRALPTQRAAALAAALVAHGAPEAALAAGIFDDPDGSLHLVFRVFNGEPEEGP